MEMGVGGWEVGGMMGDGRWGGMMQEHSAFELRGLKVFILFRF